MEAVMHWISVNDKLPEENKFVITWNGESHCFAWISEGDWDTLECYRINEREYYQDKDLITGITHWMPLPEPPKTEIGIAEIGFKDNPYPKQ